MKKVYCLFMKLDKTNRVLLGVYANEAKIDDEIGAIAKHFHADKNKDFEIEEKMVL